MLKIDPKRCTLCCQCVKSCPFEALTIEENQLRVSDACICCGLCVQECEAQALCMSNDQAAFVDKSKWNGILVYVEHQDGKIHPITYELIGIASELAKSVSFEVNCLLVGQGMAEVAKELSHYDIGHIFVYDDSAFEYYREDVYANAFEDCINETMPSVVLIGGTDVGKSIAPVVATRFSTGLTADCTGLEMKENTDLVQIRPAFGGNIMAQIATTHHRPQFATVRYNIMKEAKRTEHRRDNIVHRFLSADQLNSKIEVLNSEPIDNQESISAAKVLIVAGQGFKRKEDLWMVEEVARLLNAQLASSRALVEKGWMSPDRQIGLSGNAVKPEIILTIGVSGSIQFMTGMKGSKTIIAINSDPNAPIFSIAHLPIYGDLYTILPKLIARLTERSK